MRAPKPSGFLFGIGLAIQFDRLSKNPHRLVLLVRRLTVLLAIGAAHLFLLWNGDILVEYAIAGLVTLQTRRGVSAQLLPPLPCDDSIGSKVLPCYSRERCDGLWNATHRAAFGPRVLRHS